jgi:hypothetical protein
MAVADDLLPPRLPQRRESDPRESRLEHKLDTLIFAVFGNPMDSDDHGIVGEQRALRTMMHDKLDKIFVAVMGAMGVIVIAAVTVALATR